MGEGWMARASCPSREVVLFCRQLQVMLASGIPVYQALETLSEREGAPDFGRAVQTLATKIAQGHKLSRVMMLFPRIFDIVFVSLIAVGEETGRLDKCLDRLAAWEEKDQETRQRLISAMTYPTLVLGLTVLMTFFLFTSILPGFIGIFEQMGASIPLPTRVLIALTNMATSPGFWLLGIVLSVTLGHGFMRYARTSEGATTLTLLAMAVPVLGPMLLNLSAARFAASISTMLDTGMDLTRALALGAQASGNAAMRKDSGRVLRDIRMGSLTSVSLSERPDLYPSNLLQMVAVGEQSSTISDMFERAAEFHEAEANQLMAGMAAALEPVLLGLVATLLGFVLISVFLPLYGYLDKL